ncbi:hypothetical protein JHK85_036762 [Glycine max]|nr:hypothetical protein JHK85_036762 [Glycine max]KAG4976743.1 hypothetical protein JHK86_036217 [Glycine max]
MFSNPRLFPHVDDPLLREASSKLAELHLSTKGVVVAHHMTKVYMEDDYVRKMSDEVDMEVDMDNEVRIDEDIHKDYG